MVAAPPDLDLLSTPVAWTDADGRIAGANAADAALSERQKELVADADVVIAQAEYACSPT